MLTKVSVLALLLMPSLSEGSIISAYREIGRGNLRQYPKVITNLVKNGFYFTAIPHVKEYLANTKKVTDPRIDKTIDEIITRVGVRQFEVLPTKILKRSKAPIVRYILARKYFRAGKYNKALAELDSRIPYRHPAHPYALALKGSILSLKGKNRHAISLFKACIDASKKEIKRHSDKNRIRQLNINKDTCLVGIPRTQFAAQQYAKANSSYLDLSKKSPIWPEILFEEAWNSFYLQNYNRTLGKLVTYKAPILNYVFNPEVGVLKALTYFQICLYDDARETVKNYYDEYESGSLRVSNTLKKHGKDYRYYYTQAKKRIRNRIDDPFFARMLNAIVKDPAFVELYDSFNSGKDELEKVKRVKSSSIRRILKSSLKEALLLQRDLIGSYVRKRLLLYIGQINKAFEGISYISLEINKIKKEELYGVEDTGKRHRGDIKNLERTSKQYFWTFNGEFWADELGDYAFSLKSKCDKK